MRELYPLQVDMNIDKRERNVLSMSQTPRMNQKLRCDVCLSLREMKVEESVS